MAVAITNLHHIITINQCEQMSIITVILSQVRIPKVIARAVAAAVVALARAAIPIHRIEADQLYFHHHQMIKVDLKFVCR